MRLRTDGSRRGVPAVPAMFILAAAFLSGCAPANEIDDAFTELTRIRREKGEALSVYFEHVRETVESVQEDRELLDAFVALNDLYHGTASVDSSAVATLRTLEAVVVDRYLDDYQLFLDVHFIDESGDVFYSVLKQDNLFHNVFEEDPEDSPLAGKLRDNPESATLDFRFPGYGSEPSAFFAQPVHAGGDHRGWVVFQFASSRLQEIFSYEPSLGRTGEVFLVNRDQFMLTDSYNSPESAVLRRHLSAENILTKFAEGEGEKLVVDYRGYEALTSFKVYTIMGFDWLLIAKIDRDEVITRQYLEDPPRYHERLREYLRSADFRDAGEEALAAMSEGREVEKVFLDDFRRIDDSSGDEAARALFTPGVATCTSIVISLPGRFAYMAHVSPYDRMYEGSRTDLIRTMLRRVHDFEVADKEIREVQVAIVTPTIRYSERIVDELVDAGIFLSQITFMKNPEARCADVYFDFESGETAVTWCYGTDFEERSVQFASRTPSLGTIMERFLPE
ncbi:MAG: cache domain-containing protein [Spirochaetota bacterium]